ncbi:MULTISPECIES: MbtH family protein [unclassified Solwaraspora]|uniref:MbtH family protein n=1 Tax=unclassified Solwaraspora TaxID=2627926 RepID=UPI00259BA90A|nr:MbtH family protein [Solwaraspora sp. WMMA2056]WJK38717.1 MbtH family protein [Solwaraspora sp. WMMA2056]
MFGDDETIVYAVVLNQEEQYSIWPHERDVPAGWSQTGMVGTKAECLEHIEKIWVDMRPRSLRDWLSGEVSS